VNIERDGSIIGEDRWVVRLTQEDLEDIVRARVEDLFQLIYQGKGEPDRVAIDFRKCVGAIDTVVRFSSYKNTQQS